MRNIGILCIVVGVVMMIFTGFNLITKEKVVDVGPIEINKEEKTPVNWSPVVGGVLIVAGIGLIIADKKK